MRGHPALWLALAITVLPVLAAEARSSIADGAPAFAGRRLLTGTWGVPTPPPPSYPCRTTVPNTAGFTTIYVNGRSRAASPDGSSLKPYRTFADAWGAVPKYTPLTRGIVIKIQPGTVGNGIESFWMEGGWGTASAPIVVTRATSSGTVNLQSINVFNCTYLYFKDVQFIEASGSYGGGDVVHFAHCDYIYLLSVRIQGLIGDAMPQETLKVNQVKGMYVEDSTIQVAGDNALDFVAVQYGHICRSNIGRGNWCMYVKGGSSYLLIDSNTVNDCNEAGLRVGQGTGFEYMVYPWLNYEAYGITVTNNVVTNTFGAALGVAGGYNVLVAYNSVYNSGQRSHMVEFLFGSHSCDGDTDLPNQCTINRGRGGWGPANGGDAIPVPNKNVFFYNNLLVNPPSRPSEYTHFEAPSGPTDETPGPSPVTNPSVADNLRIAGNVFVNRRLDGNPMELGLGACDNSNPSCNEAQVNADNAFNRPGLSAAILFRSYATLALKPTGKVPLKTAWVAATPPAFAGWSTPLATAAGSLTNAVPTDKAGVPRSAANNLPGAFV